METRIPNPALSNPATLKALIALSGSAGDTGVPKTTHYLMHVRASQINGCSGCLEMHTKEIRKAGEYEAARHYDEKQLSSLVLSIAAINTWNRLNVATRQIAGAA